MYLSNYEFRLLRYIHRNPYVDFSVLAALSAYKANPLRFEKAISRFCLNEVIESTPFCSPKDDTGTRYSKEKFPCDHMHLVLSEYGQSIIDERIRKFWGFVLPYAITTLIAFAALFTKS